MSTRTEFTKQSLRVWTLGPGGDSFELGVGVSGTVSVAGRSLTLKRRGVLKVRWLILDGATEVGALIPDGAARKTSQLSFDGATFSCAAGRSGNETWFSIENPSGSLRYEVSARQLRVNAEGDLAEEIGLVVLGGALAQLDFRVRVDDHREGVITGSAG